jgi:hypothetical protein
LAQITTTFTTWRELLDRLRDDLANPSFRTMQSYTINSAGTGGSRTIMYRSLKELRELIDWVEQQVVVEEGGARSFRSYAKNGGRG